MSTVVSSLNLAVLWGLLALNYYSPRESNKLLAGVAGTMFTVHFFSAIGKVVSNFLA